MKTVIYAVRLTCNNNKEQHSPQNSAQRKMRTAIICLSLTDHYFPSFFEKTVLQRDFRLSIFRLSFCFCFGFFSLILTTHLLQTLCQLRNDRFLHLNCGDHPMLSQKMPLNKLVTQFTQLTITKFEIALI